MTSLHRCSSWPVEHVAAAVIRHDSDAHLVVETYGDTTASFRLASLTKPMSAWAVLVAVEEGIVALDAELSVESAGQPGVTLRHLLSHAGGYGFTGATPISRPERTRTYSNGGIELAAHVVAAASEMTFAEYLALAVFEPLGMAATSLRSSPAYGAWSTIHDVVQFLNEARAPTLLRGTNAAEAITIQYPSLGGMVPGVGRYSECTWGLGFEIRGDKSPHWTGARNSPGTYGHFGGAGTMMWTDRRAGLSLVALTDRPFEQWAPDALRLWPELSDAVIGEYATGEGPTGTT